MGTIQSQFSDDFQNNVFMTVTGTISATQFMTGTANMIRFKADPDNSDDFMIGDENSQPYKLAPGDDTGWNSCRNLNQFWYQATSGAVDYLLVWYKY